MNSMKKRTYKYSTNNTSFKKVAKIYPYNTNLFANVYFHIMDHDYDADSLDELLNKFDEQIHGKTVYEDLDEDEPFDDENKAFNIDKFMNDIENDDESDEEYLNSLYEEYMDAVSEYLSDILCCDMIFGYKFANATDFESYEEVLEETDRSKFRVVMVGIRFSNTVDEKVFENFREAIVADEQFLDTYNDIRKLNMHIINNAIDEAGSIVSTLTEAILNVIVKYIQNHAEYYIPTNHETIEMPLDNGQSLFIETGVDGFFPTNRFKLSFDLNSYSINEYMLNKVLDNVYGNIIRFGNAINIVSESAKKIELFKYDNDTKTCLLIKNDSGCTYLFLDGWKSK